MYPGIVTKNKQQQNGEEAVAISDDHFHLRHLCMTTLKNMYFYLSTFV